MRLNIKVIPILFILAIIFSCSVRNSDCLQKELYLKKWKEDTCGCFGQSILKDSNGNSILTEPIRDVDSALFIIECKRLRKPSSKDINQIFGQPDSIVMREDNSFEYRYYAQSLCDSKNNSIEVLSIITFYFSKNKLTDVMGWYID